MFIRRPFSSVHLGNMLCDNVSGYTLISEDSLLSYEMMSNTPQPNGPRECNMSVFNYIETVVDIIQTRIGVKPLVVGGGLVAGTWLVLRYRRPRGAPPGPLHIPIFGNSMIFTNRPGDMYGEHRECKETYGGIFSIYQGSR